MIVALLCLFACLLE